MDNNWILVAIGAAVVIGGAVYYFASNKKEETAEVPLKAEEMEKLTFAYVEDYFKKSYVPVKEANPNVKPIALRVKGDIFSNNDTESLFFLLTYYNEDTKEILTDNTKYIKAKSIDVNLKDAFGDKDMLVLS